MLAAFEYAKQVYLCEAMIDAICQTIGRDRDTFVRQFCGWWQREHKKDDFISIRIGLEFCKDRVDDGLPLPWE